MIGKRGAILAFTKIRTSTLLSLKRKINGMLAIIWKPQMGVNAINDPNPIEMALFSVVSSGLINSFLIFEKKILLNFKNLIV